MFSEAQEAISRERVLGCPGCGGTERTTKHPVLRDMLFGAPGEWSMARCNSCGTLFLDPRPAPSDIGKVYATYSVHQKGKLSQATAKRAGSGSTLRAGYKAGLLSELLGYPMPLPYPPGARLLTRVVRALFPFQVEFHLSGVMFLRAVPGGRLLDVGCGGGAFLNKMNALGWNGEGVELDENSVKIAREAGLQVRRGQLEDQGYPEGHFDAITVKHVIEHVYHPSKLLSECRRILKPGGKLIVMTPNPLSYGHLRFGKFWRGLEPPRHLSLLTPEALGKLAAGAGLDVLVLRTSARTAAINWRESQRIRLGEAPSGWWARIRASLFAFRERRILASDQYCGEEIIMESTR